MIVTNTHTQRTIESALSKKQTAHVADLIHLNQFEKLKATKKKREKERNKTKIVSVV